MVTIIEGDVVAALQTGVIDVLGHQVNLDGVMGAGIARRIARTWPPVLPAYRQALLDHRLALGGVHWVSVGPSRWVANIAGQQHAQRRGCATDYAALERGLHTMAEFLRAHTLRGGLPYGLGCGLAGGDWTVVHAMLLRVFADTPLTCFRLP